MGCSASTAKDPSEAGGRLDASTVSKPPVQQAAGEMRQPAVAAAVVKTAEEPTVEAKISSATKEMVTNNGGGARKVPKWIQETLDTHNALRAKHGVPPLKWSDESAEKAQLCADYCGGKDTMHHCHCSLSACIAWVRMPASLFLPFRLPVPPLSAVFFGTPGFFGAADAVQSWYDEINNPGYQWNARTAEGGAPGCGHFTQVVWRDTSEVGMAADAYGKGYIVANYWPAGNMQGNYGENVPQLGAAAQKRKEVRRTPFEGTLTSLDDPDASVIDSCPINSIQDKIRAELQAGRPVKISYSPSPNGKIEYSFTNGMMGSCSFG
uniref:SCP domain-containing protein n=1 Tax=Chromera velia CCMP2878 TaxID=1169474 RepID=A0A0G4HXP2_9ALVE|eukprot:Cvel_9309.t1-p1 / transcript=Cvel_9309.t1 / gene=Cvel_9309 / organism=Chromera_velia_CCMP2878 / gene_product=Pathogenesis-related protein 1C, putative / transcript_product=Pathogenesis-related protein 1C, putative / location=Cvel_scaffold533:54485-58416(+) / protein_length=321 / sequence_SO=supercontig / SO=protein_coding / is_pseudo=false